MFSWNVVLADLQSETTTELTARLQQPVASNFDVPAVWFSLLIFTKVKEKLSLSTPFTLNPGTT
jgi:hypothetical protein